MKRILCIILSILMLLSLAACSQPDPEQEAFEAACALLEEGNYAEAIEAFSQLESYRKVQEKIDAAEAGLEAQRLAAEKAAREAELEKLGFLYGTTWHELGGTIELTFEEYQHGGSPLHCRYWDDWGNLETFDTHWEFIDGEIRVAYFPGLDPDVAPGAVHPVTAEERDGITHLLVGDLDFVRSEDYGPFAPMEIQITLDNWQEYFELRSGIEWSYDDFGTTNGLRCITAICPKEEYQHRLVLEKTNVTFGVTRDFICADNAQVDLEAHIALPGSSRQVLETDRSHTEVFGRCYSTVTDNTTIPELPQIYLAISSAGYVYDSVNSRHWLYFYDDHNIDRVMGTLVLRPE